MKYTAGGAIIMGGINAKCEVLSSVTIFDPVDQTYAELPPLNYPRDEAASCVYNNDVVIAGGSDGHHGLDTVEILKSNQHPPRWTIFIGSLRFRLSCHVLIVYQGRLLVIGGYNWDRREISDEIYELAPAPPYSRMFPTKMPQPRNMHRAETVNGKLFILGGSSTSDPSDGMNSVIMYDPITNGFIECVPLPRPVSGMSTVTWGNKIIVVGGVDENFQDLNDVIMYDTESGQSERLPSMNHKRNGPTAVILNDVIFVFGGYNEEEGHLNSVESFTMGGGQQSWIEQPREAEERLDATAVAKHSM